MRADRQVPQGKSSNTQDFEFNPHYPHCIKLPIRVELPSAKETIQQ